MRLSQSVPGFAVVLAAILAAGCDRDVNSVTAPPTVPTVPNALAVPSAGYTHVASHGSYSCASRADNGDAVCWGYNAYGATTRWPGNYTQVSAGLDVACALRTDGIAECWGGWQVGQDNPPAVALIDVGAGNTYGCGIRDTFALVCWGNTSFSAAVPPAGTYGMLSVGDLRACAIRVADRGVTCWGEGDLSAPAGVFFQISVGSQHACGVRGDYTLSCWGSNNYGESNAPSGTFTQVSAGDYHTCAIRATDESIVCWGFDSGGRLSPPAGAYREVSAGAAHTCAIRTDGALACWGFNDHGQSSPPAVPVTRVAPSATFTAPASVNALDSIVLAMSNAKVTGYPQATTFTYRFDCGDGNGYGSATAETQAKCATTVVEKRTVRGMVIDQDGDTASYSAIVQINSRPQTVTITSTPPSPAYVNATYTLSASASSGLPVTVIASVPNVCSATGVTVTFLGVGDCRVAVEQTGNSTYKSAIDGQVITVVRRPQTITFNAPPASAAIGTSVTLSVTGGASGNPVVLSSLTPATCTVTGSVVQPTAIGGCTIAANQSGNAAYDAAPQVTLTITVVWPFTGFVGLAAEPAVNQVRAGSSIPLTFSLGGNRGLNVLAAGSPTVAPYVCNGTLPAPGSGTALPLANNGALAYSTKTGQYTITWKPMKREQDCRLVSIRLTDGTVHTARFQLQ